MKTKIKCEKCGSIISEREIALYRGLVSALWRVYKWCKEKGVKEFRRKDIKHLFTNENDTARFGDWIHFGSLMVKYGKGRYGLIMETCDEFFAGRYAVPIRVWKNPITGELRREEFKKIGEIPSILTLLNEDQEYVARYRKPVEIPSLKLF